MAAHAAIAQEKVQWQRGETLATLTYSTQKPISEQGETSPFKGVFSLRIPQKSSEAGGAAPDPRDWQGTFEGYDFAVFSAPVSLLGSGRGESCAAGAQKKWVKDLEEPQEARRLGLCPQLPGSPASETALHQPALGSHHMGVAMETAEL